jgi:hypothetical protein
MENLTDVQMFVKCKCGCQKNLPIGREDKEFLNRAHKQRAKRYRDRVYRYCKEATQRLDAMQKYLDDPDMKEAATAELAGLRQRVNEMIGKEKATRKAANRE